MILARLWERYLFKEIIKVFALFLLTFYFVYAALDYSTHMQEFIKDSRIQFDSLILYYWYQFIKRADLLIPLALLIATIKVLTSFNAHHELLALQLSGMKMQRLLRPFFVIGIACMLFNYINFEVLNPKALNFLDQFHRTHFRHNYRKGTRKDTFHILYLKDQSKLIYQTYDLEKNAFFDVIWLRSIDDIWRMKYLVDDPSRPEAEFADHLQRDDQGLMIKTDSHEKIVLSELKWDKEMSQIGAIPFENRSISSLYRLYFLKTTTTAYHSSEILTHFIFKMVIPLLSVIVIIAAAPFCVTFRRHMPLVFLYAIFLFGFLALYVLLDSAVILGQNRVLSPIWAIGLPFITIVGALFFKYKRVIGI